MYRTHSNVPYVRNIYRIINYMQKLIEFNKAKCKKKQPTTIKFNVVTNR